MYNTASTPAERLDSCSSSSPIDAPLWTQTLHFAQDQFTLLFFTLVLLKIHVRAPSANFYRRCDLLSLGLPAPPVIPMRPPRRACGIFASKFETRYTLAPHTPRGLNDTIIFASATRAVFGSLEEAARLHLLSLLAGMNPGERLLGLPAQCIVASWL